MSDNKRIAKNTIFLYIRMSLIMGVSLYTSRVILATLGVDDFGIYNVVGGIVTMFSFLNGSLGGATSRYITFELGRKDYEKLNKVFNVALLTHIFIGLIIVILSETIGLWFFYEKMIIPEERVDAAFWVFQISILSSLASLIQVPYNATIIAHEDMKVYAYVGIIEAFLKLVVVYMLAFSPFDTLVYYAILLCLINVGLVSFYRLYCIRLYPESQIRLCKQLALYKDMFKFAGSDLIGNVSVLAQGQGLNLLLNVFFGPVVNAARAIAYQVQGAITQFGNNFMTAVRPQIIKLYAQGEVREMFKLVYLASNFSYYLMWLLILPLCLEADYILTLWLGKYPDHSVSFLILVFILCLIQTLKTPRTIVLHATGKLFLANIVIGTLLCCAFPLAYVFLRIGGEPESVFWAANITMLLSEFISVFIVRKYVNYNIADYLLNVHGRCTIVTVVSLLLPYFLFDRYIEPSFIRLILTYCLTTVSIAATVWCVGMNKDMRNKTVSFIQSKIQR
ncbi:MATE family efflux transporter [Segatella bryantii]|uniref:MATE family efflux transporter n=1 Tax=Segatella bryantii TaxID=77095 RepID=UPI00247A7EF1|nr:MATE family efflux transporter [Segatella bryantii]